MLQLLECFFTHLVVLEHLNHHQNVISSSLYHPGAATNISPQSVYRYLSKVYKQTDSRTDRQTNATKNVTTFCCVHHPSLSQCLPHAAPLPFIMSSCINPSFHNAFFVYYPPLSRCFKSTSSPHFTMPSSCIIIFCPFDIVLLVHPSIP